MAKIEKVSTYFLGYGPENTDNVIEAVSRRLEEGDIKTVVVASTSVKLEQNLRKHLKTKPK